MRVAEIGVVRSKSRVQGGTGGRKRYVLSTEEEEDGESWWAFRDTLQDSLEGTDPPELSLGDGDPGE